MDDAIWGYSTFFVNLADQYLKVVKDEATTRTPRCWWWASRSPEPLIFLRR